MSRVDPGASASGAGASQSALQAGFCPQGGLVPESSVQFSEEIRCLLGRRLRFAALIVFAASLAFLVRSFVWEPVFVASSTATVQVPHVALTLVLGLLAGLLFARPCLSLRAMRRCELLIFGLPALFIVWSETIRTCECSPEEVVFAAYAFPGRATIPWLVMLGVYGVFIPNTRRRAAAVVSVMALIPLAGALLAAYRQEAVRQVLFEEGFFSAMVIWILVAAVTAARGSYRFGTLRRQAFDAHRVGVYTLRKKLGTGGMGDVYLAEHRLLKRTCAIKLIRPDKADDAQALARFESEVRSTARLTHPNTVEIYDYGHTNDGTFYYAMEFLPGMNLQEVVQRYGPLPPERVVYLLRQVCSALKEAHGNGLIHRDIKPGNIFAAERGGLYDVAKLLDFGLVKSLVPEAESVNLTIDGAVIGSPLYCCPEAALGEPLDARSDVYSLGATAYYLLTGRPLFEGDNPIKVLFAHAKETPNPPSSHNRRVPADLQAVVMKCLEKSPDDRYQDVSELESALSDCACANAWTQQRASKWWSDTGEDMLEQPEASPESATVTMMAAEH